MERSKKKNDISSCNFANREIENEKSEETRKISINLK